MYVAINTMLHLADATGSRTIPTEIDLGSPDAPMLLSQFDNAWTSLPPRLRDNALANLHLTVLPPEPHGHGVAVLPGGAVALRAGVEGVLVCDPHQSAVLGRDAAQALRTRLSDQPGLLSAAHQPDGMVLRSGPPAGAPPRQSCTVLPDASVLAGIVASAQSWCGRVLVQWHPAGAAVWALTEAPDCLALVASIAATALECGAAPLRTGPWQDTDLDSRIESLGPGVFDRVNDLLTDEVSDDLRYALARHAVEGDNSVAARLADALRLLPSVFGPLTEDGAGYGLLAAWPRAAKALASHAADLAMIGIEGGVAGADGLAALRAVLDHEGLLFAERPAPGRMVALAGHAAQAAAARLDEGNRYGALIALPADPQALFAFADTLSRRLGARIIAAAPCWGFYHRIDHRDDTEAGNAAWFGLGAGLDELDWL